MTIESRELFELCKRVYEATGWDDTDNYKLAHTSVAVPPKDLPLYEVRDGKEYRSENWTNIRFPLYTSDYLLEKLPKGVSVSKNKKGMYGVWVVHREEDTFNESESPLKALLKLTLKLHEEGLL